MYQLATIDVPSNTPSLKVTFNPSTMDEDGYPDLVLISPEDFWYDYSNWDDNNQEFRRDVAGNTYTGYGTDPEIMEILTPTSGTWKIGVYPQSDKPNVTYTLSANLNITKSEGATFYKY